MASLSWDLTRHNGVTLVELVVTADAEEWVRVNSRLRPVWPPRRQGVPVAGWDDACFEGRVGPDAPLVLGYASPAAPADPPVELEPVGADGEFLADDRVSPRAIVRALGESAPPRDVVPTGDTRERSGRATTTDRDRAAADRSPGTSNGIDPATEDREPQSTEAGRESHSTEEVEAIEPWFEAIEGRVEEAERLADVTGVDEARGAVTAVGGIEAARELRERLEADRRRLRALGERQRQLADQLAAVQIPLSTLERVT
jgi:hypothetical protein